MKGISSIVALATLTSLTWICSAQELPVITLRRTACYGSCPVYSLEIFEDGRLHYDGKQCVAVTGRQEGHISHATVKALIADFLKADYFDLKDVYESRQNPDGTSEWITDLPTTYTSLRIGNKAKTVKDYAFSPQKLQMLEMEIDRVSDTHQWIHASDDLESSENVQTDIHQRIKPGMNLFMQAAGKGDQDAMAKERDNGAIINAQDETGWTALMLAAEQCHEPAVRQLLDWKAALDLKDNRGDDALMGAASAYCFEPSTRKAQADIIKLLIARGADPNSANNLGVTPLMVVSTHGNEEATRVLIDAGARLDSRDGNGKTPLDHARDMLKKYEDSWWADELKQIVYLLEENQNPIRPASPRPD
jgi:hypothetical protein